MLIYDICPFDYPNILGELRSSEMVDAEKFFLKNAPYLEAKYVAYCDESLERRLVALALFDSTGENELTELGTWVESDYRNRGIATELWRLVLEKTKPTRVYVWGATPAGQKLIAKARWAFPSVDWVE